MYDRKAIKKEARRITKQLNKLDQDIAYNVHDSNRSIRNLSNLSNKVAKRKSRGKGLTPRLEKKIDEEGKRLIEANENIRRGQEETKKILSSLPETMDITDRAVMRQSQRANDFVKDALNPHRMITFMGPIYGSGYEFVQGKEYKVKAKSKKELAKVKEENYKKNMDRIQEKYDLAHEKEKEYLKKHPGAKEGEDYDFVEKFYTKADEEIEKKYKR